MSHTFSIVEVEPSTYEDIKQRLLAAAHSCAIKSHHNEGEVIDMSGLAITMPSDSLQARVRQVREEWAAVHAKEPDLLETINASLARLQTCPCSMCSDCIDLLCETIIPAARELSSLRGRVTSTRRLARGPGDFTVSWPDRA